MYQEVCTKSEKEKRKGEKKSEEIKDKKRIMELIFSKHNPFFEKESKKKERFKKAEQERTEEGERKKRHCPSKKSVSHFFL